MKKPTVVIQPRMMTEQQVCAYLGDPGGILRHYRKEGEKHGIGFPGLHPVLKLYDKHEVNRWIDELASTAIENEFILALQDDTPQKKTRPPGR